MLVRCIATRLSTDQQSLLKATGPTPDYQFRVGEIYLVLGVTFMLPEEPHGGGAQYQLLDDFGDLRIAPALLFELKDRRCSRHWLARTDDDGAMLLWPGEFFAKYFHDDLSEGVAEVRAVFEQVVEKMRSEAAEILEP
jgi:hypothetical protein